MKEIQPKKPVDTKVSVPGSKSMTHRALITAGLAHGESHLLGFLECEDTRYTANALKELGVRISTEGDKLLVSGVGGKFQHSPRRKEIFLGNSGTSYRLLLSVVGLTRGEFLITGSPRMNERPISDLVGALNQLGVEASYVNQEGFPPVLIKARGIAGGKVELPGRQSSQYVSSLLLSAPYAKGDIEIEVRGELVSKPYVDLTLDVMEQFGVRFVREGYSYFRVASGQKYGPRHFTIEGDVSSASYFWAAAAVTGGTITTEGIRPFATRQGDVDFLRVLEEMGCRVEKQTDRVIVRGGRLSGIDADMGSMPDMVPTLAAVSLFAHGRTAIRNVAHLRYKESDRLSSITLELGKLGGLIEELPDGLIIHGGGPLSGAVVDPNDDHRIAMSLAVVGSRVPGIKIAEARCVNKSFPQFWEMWDRF